MTPGPQILRWNLIIRLFHLWSLVPPLLKFYYVHIFSRLCQRISEVCTVRPWSALQKETTPPALLQVGRCSPLEPIREPTSNLKKVNISPLKTTGTNYQLPPKICPSQCPWWTFWTSSTNGVDRLPYLPSSNSSGLRHDWIWQLSSHITSSKGSHFTK